MTGDDLKKAEAALLAEEQALKEKWCRLKGHRWDLPTTSPFNNGFLTTCEIICNRCNAHATVTVTIDGPVPSAPPAPEPKPTKP
jgi:hypothetical protein